MKRLFPWLGQLNRRTTDASADSDAAAAACRFKLASYNIHKCVGTDGRFDPQRIKQVILALDADIVVLQEADARFGEREGLLDLSYLHAAGGYQSAVALQQGSRSHGWHGNVVLYRSGIVHDVHQLTLPGLEPRGAVLVDFGIEQASFRLLAVHFGLLRQSRMRQVQAIIDAADPHPDRHVIIVGDMNEWRLKNRSALDLFKHHFDEVSQNLPSYPSRLPLLPLDRLFISPGLRSEGMSVVDTPLTRLASDHLPLTAKLSFQDRF
jgi:endonuclease/exonuclease/phosphatase family metal-dependent hydrolase